jgi:two-component system, OmpR family, phosphate regulon sensor histidine kinase PhoR
MLQRLRNGAVQSLADRLLQAARGGAGALRERLRFDSLSPASGLRQRAARVTGGAQSWRLVIDALSEPAVVLDRAGVVLHHNAAVGALFPKIRSGQSLIGVLRSPALFAAIDASQGSVAATVVEFQERVPLERLLAASVAPLAIGGGMNAPALLVTFRDLTDRSRFAEMRSDFVANASHELRTPLASLSGFVDTLQGPARDDPAARDRFLGLMAGEARRMRRLIDDLLSLTRVEQHLHIPPKGIVDLDEVAAYVAETLAPVAEAESQTISVTPQDGDARITGEREEIVQVVQNLVHNAIRYGREGGAIGVRVTYRPPAVAGRRGQVAVAVSDDGPGIAEQHLPRLTERFYRVNAASSRAKGGTGLGLAIVKYIVVRHGGELKIVSTVGKGSTFTVSFEALANVATPGTSR